jgi:hypothetical protein
MTLPSFTFQPGSKTLEGVRNSGPRLLCSLKRLLDTGRPMVAAKAA